MKKLLELGLSNEELNNIIEVNGNICNSDIDGIIIFLSSIGCSYDLIKNIIISNPFIINRNVDDIKNLIGYLYKIGLNKLNLFLGSNPYILNMDKFEVEEFVNGKLSQGINLDDICDIIEVDPYCFNE